MAAYMKARREKHRIFAIEHLGGRCVRCGSSDLLEIDHDHSQGKKNVYPRILDCGLSRLPSELAKHKCQLLCRKHHRDKTIEHGESGGGHNKLSYFPHGVTGYTYGCRCKVCGDAHYARSRKNATSKPRPRWRVSQSPIDHGIQCHCESCVKNHCGAV